MRRAIGRVVLEIKPKVALMSAEAFGKFKVCFDVALVTLAILLSLLFTRRVEGVREGSLVAACITGYIVSLLNRKIMTRKTLYKVLGVFR